MVTVIGLIFTPGCDKGIGLIFTPGWLAAGTAVRIPGCEPGAGNFVPGFELGGGSFVVALPGLLRLYEALALLDEVKSLVRQLPRQRVGYHIRALQEAREMPCDIERLGPAQKKVIFLSRKTPAHPG